RSAARGHRLATPGILKPPIGFSEMRPLPKSIRSPLFLAGCCCFAFAQAYAEGLQWQHAPNMPSRPASSPSVATGPPVEYVTARTPSPPTAKRPTSHLPAPLPDMAGAQPIKQAQSTEVYRGPGYQAQVAPALQI